MKKRSFISKRNVAGKLLALTLAFVMLLNVFAQALPAAANANEADTDALVEMLEYEILEVDADINELIDEVDTEEVDTEEVDTEEADTEEADTEEVDTEEVDTEEVDTEEIDSEEVEELEATITRSPVNINLPSAWQGGNIFHA